MHSGLNRLCRGVTRQKPLEDMLGTSELHRCLNTANLTVLGAGSMVGAGLYVLTGVVAKNTTGPAIMISYMIAGLVSLLSAMCYAEFGCRIPKTGSAYTYTYVAIGEVWAFLIGWNLILEYVVAAASVARSWSGYLDNLIGNKISNFTITHVLAGHRWDAPFVAEYPDIFGAIVLYVVLAIVITGASISAGATAVMLIVNCLVVGFVFFLGLAYADIHNWTDYGGFAPYGTGGIIAGAATLFYAFVGFDVIAVSGEEALDQLTSIPRATLVSLAVAITLYVAVSISLTLLVPYTEIVKSSALASAFSAHNIYWAQYIVGIGALCGMFTTLLGSLFSLPRSVYAMASDGILFSAFARVNERTKVPVLACVVFGTISAIMTIVFDVEALVEFLSIGVLMAYATVSAALIRIRYTSLGEQLYNLDMLADDNNSETEISRPSTTTENENATYLPMQNIPGTLKEKYRSRFVFLTRYEPGNAVCISLMVSTVLQFVSVTAITLTIDQLQSGAWWAWLLVTICCLLAIGTFLPIPMHNQTEIKNGFKVPLCPYIPALSILCNIILMLQLSCITWIRFAVWMSVGVLIYAFYGYRYSVLGRAHIAAQRVSYNVLQTDDSTYMFAKTALYRTIERQQPRSKIDVLYDSE